MLKNLFRRSAEDMTPQQIMGELTDRLERWGYFYDHDTNNRIRNDMVREAGLSMEGAFCEGDVCPEKIFFRQNYSYRYLAVKAVLVRENPAVGVGLGDTVRFFEENYYCDFPLEKDEPFPSVTVRKEMSVGEILAEPHPAPVEHFFKRAVSSTRAFLNI